MKTIFNLSLIIISTVLLFSSCSKDEGTTTPTGDKNFTFAKVGNKWIFASTDQNGPSPDVTMEVIQYMGNNTYKIANVFPGSQFGTVIVYWYVNGEELSFNCDSTGTHKDMFVSGATQLNTTYMSIVHYNPFLQPGDTLYMKITSLNTPVTVPAGTFECIRILVWGTPYNNMPETEVFMSRNYGQIKQSNQHMTLELKSKNF